MIGERGRGIYSEKLSIRVIGNLLDQAISDLVPNK